MNNNNKIIIMRAQADQVGLEDRDIFVIHSAAAFPVRPTWTSPVRSSGHLNFSFLFFSSSLR